VLHLSFEKISAITGDYWLGGIQGVLETLISTMFILSIGHHKKNTRTNESSRNSRP
jgi:hypothetical protein